MPRGRWGVVSALALLLTGALQGQPAPRTGTIEGRVTEAGSGRPLADAQAAIVTIGRGARTSETGAFRLTAVPAGTYAVKIIRIGYEAQSVTVTVTANQTSSVNVALRSSTTILDAIVVTGTGDQQRRREQGTNVAVITTDNVPLPAVANFSQVLSSRSPGVNVSTAGGTTGGGSRIRIRGANSISLANDPLLVIDGVRVNAGANSSSIGVGGQVPSRFDDLNPEDIETIEILKGPAGVALYGLQAANGVIQVTTKRGREGKAQWNLFSEGGGLFDPTTYPDNYWQAGYNAAGTRINQCNIDSQAQNACFLTRTGSPALTDSLYRFNPLQTPEITPLRDGWRSQFGAAVGGGTQQSNYRVSGDFDREFGVIGANDMRRINSRGRFAFTPNEKTSVDVSVGYLNSTLLLPQNDNNANGAISGGILGRGRDCGGAAGSPLRAGCAAGDTASRGFFNANNPARNFFAISVLQEIQRLTSSVNFRYQPKTWLTATLVQGIDILSRYDHSLLPNGRVFTSADNAAGTRAANRFNINTYTTTGTLTSNYTVTGGLRGNTLVSVQYNADIFRGSNASGIGLIPGTSSLATTSRNFAVNETNQPFYTIGAVVQQSLNWNDRLFLTGGFRTDDNSAFGVTTGPQVNPTVQASWVLSEEKWFPKGKIVDQFRIRSAYATNLTRPGFRDAVTTLSAVAVTAGGEQAAVTANTAGNAGLLPESVREFETGFDFSGWGGAVSLELTYFNKTTSNALVAQPLPPSVGNAGTRFANIGAVRNYGFEGLLRTRLVEKENVAFSLDFNVATLKNELTRLGNNIPPFFLGASQRFVEGFPMGGYWERPITRAGDLNGDGIVSRVNCRTVGGVSAPQVAGGPACEVTLDDSLQFIGGVLPTLELSVLPRLTLFKYFDVSANLNSRSGHYLFNNTFFFRCQPNPNNCRELMDRGAPVADQIRGVSALMGTRYAFVEPADFWRVREFAFSATAPTGWARKVGLGSARLTVAGTNIFLSTPYTGFDPELNSNAQANFTTTDFLTQPPVRRWTARLDLNF